MSPEYVPELGQLLTNAATGQYAVPTFVEALLDHLLAEFERVYWNTFQETCELNQSYRPEHPGTPVLDVPGLQVRSYWWGDDDAPEAGLPNFVFQDVEISWYKHPGRGMSTNVEKTADQWVAWFDAAFAAITGTEPSYY